MDQLTIILAITAGLLNSDNFQVRKETAENLPIPIARILCCHPNLEIAHLSKCCCENYIDRTIADLGIVTWPRLDVILDRTEAYRWAFAFAATEDVDFCEITITNLRQAGKAYCQYLLRKGMKPQSIRELVRWALWYEREIWPYSMLPISKLSDKNLELVRNNPRIFFNLSIPKEVIEQIRNSDASN